MIRRDTRGRTTADEPVPAVDEIARLRRLLLDMLEGPWSRTEQFARTRACVEFNHPRIHRDPARKCYCGMVKPDAD